MRDGEKSRIRKQATHMTKQEILEIALKIEREEKQFFIELAKHVVKGKIKNFLLELAKESDGHEEEIKKLLGGNREKTYNRTNQKRNREFIETHFQTDILPSLEDIFIMAPEFQNIEKVLDFAAEKERVTAEFFWTLCQYCENFETKIALVQLEKIEYQHLDKIESIRDDYIKKSGRDI
ncbi:MAG: ferritin family protein [Nitrospinales bacterium]